MEVTQTKRIGKGKPNSLFTFQRENFWRGEQEKRRSKGFEENSFPEIERETKKFSQIPRGKNKFLARFPRDSF